MKKLMDTCAKSGEFVEMKYLSPAVINGMTVRKLAKSGCTISSQNAGYLAEECGGDLTVLQNEIAKLSAYKPGKEITREDIDKLVPYRFGAGYTEYFVHSARGTGYYTCRPVRTFYRSLPGKTRLKRRKICFRCVSRV